MVLLEADSSQKNKWNDFVAQNFPIVGAFFQSWEWGEFQAALGYEIRRLVITDEDGNWQGVALTLKHVLPFGFSYYYLPRGPVFTKSLWQDPLKTEKALKLIYEALKKDNAKCIFLRLEPPLENPPPPLNNEPFILPQFYVQPRFNVVLNLDKPPEEILASFSPAMRNNVRKAERKGVKVEIKSELNEAEWLEFQKMRQETALRAGKNIYPSEKYFRELVKILPSAIFAAYHDGTLAAINIVIFFSRTATYLFGAAFTKKLSLKVSPYLHWRAMLEAKKRGFSFYDLGGIDRNRWPTLTYFKQQFGGNVITYMGNADCVFRPTLYRIYRILRDLLH
jgi:peptidoglycan pentaglycine glycine transferase (the first glycine)